MKSQLSKPLVFLMLVFHMASAHAANDVYVYMHASHKFNANNSTWYISGTFQSDRDTLRASWKAWNKKFLADLGLPEKNYRVSYEAYSSRESTEKIRNEYKARLHSKSYHVKEILNWTP